MDTAYIYARVSTEEQAQEGKSIETQEKICRKWATENDYTTLGIFKDEGKSATKLNNRPALKELLAKCQEEENISAILVQDTDRLARNTHDHLTIKTLLKKYNIRLISISQPMIDDSPEGNLIDTIIASVNAFQSQITGRKTSKVLEQKAETGWFPGGTPALGYKNVSNPNPTCTLDRQIIALNNDVAPIIKEVFEMYATNRYNMQQIADFLNEKNIKPAYGFKIHKSLVARLLRDKFYIGYFLWKGKEYKALHEPLISEDLFYRVQKIILIHNQNATRKRRYNFLLRGFIFCGDCGKQMTAEVHKKPSGLTYNLYFCPLCKRGTYIDSDELEKQIEKRFEKVQLSKEYTLHVLQTAERLLAESRASIDSDKRRLLKLKSEVEKAMREAEDSRFVYRTLSEESFGRIYQRYENQLKNVNKELENLDKDHSKNIKLLEEILRLAEDIGRAYYEADYNLRKSYINLFFKKFVVVKGKITKVALSDRLKPLIEDGSVRLRTNGLRD